MSMQTFLVPLKSFQQRGEHANSQSPVLDSIEPSRLAFETQTSKCKDDEERRGRKERGIYTFSPAKIRVMCKFQE
jgi:hypothetical protein